MQQTPGDSSDLIRLAEELEEEFKNCNDSLRYTVGEPVWTKQDSLRCLQEATAKAVRDDESFTSFIIKLMNGAREGRHKAIVQAMEAFALVKKDAEQEKFLPLRQAMEQKKVELRVRPWAAALAQVFVRDDFQDLNKLRNRDAHDLADPEVGKILKRLIGKHHIKKSDAPGWAGLQIAVMRRLLAVFREIYDAIELLQAPPVSVQFLLARSPDGVQWQAFLPGAEIPAASKVCIRVKPQPACRLLVLVQSIA